LDGVEKTGKIAVMLRLGVSLQIPAVVGNARGNAFGLKDFHYFPFISTPPEKIDV
jgi:hypothetical protein